MTLALTLHSWMIPAAFIALGIVLIFTSTSEGYYIPIPSEAFFVGGLLVIFGFGMLIGVFLP